jgi:hypothetical protein
MDSLPNWDCVKKEPRNDRQFIEGLSRSSLEDSLTKAHAATL